MLLLKITPIISHGTSQANFGRRDVWCNFSVRRCGLSKADEGPATIFFGVTDLWNMGSAISLFSFHSWQLQARHVLATKALTFSDRYYALELLEYVKKNRELKWR